MAKNRLFVSFAVEDARYRDFLVGQARNEKSPFEFIDMSVKQPWDNAWKTQCRSRIRGCDGVLALLSKNTLQAEGARWEIACAKEELVPILGVYISERCNVPPEINGCRVIEWTWSGIASFLDGL